MRSATSAFLRSITKEDNIVRYNLPIVVVHPKKDDFSRGNSSDLSSFLLHPLCNSFFGWACGWVRLGLMPLLLLLAHARRLIYGSDGTLQPCTFVVLCIPLLISSLLTTFPWGCTSVFLETISRTWQNPLSNLLEQRMTGAD